MSNTRKNHKKPTPRTPEKRYLPYEIKAVSRTRQDVQSWKKALQMVQSEDPKNFPLQLLFNEITQDALLFSQIQNRKQQVFTGGFSLKTTGGETDEAQTRLLKNSAVYRQVTNAILDSSYFGYSLLELAVQKNRKGDSEPFAIALPRTNVIPQKGLFLKNYLDEKGIFYRDMPEFGTYILEFDTGELGMLNKIVSHALFKKFAQSCWSELCEIYGIPPRVLKTNTQDPSMLKKGEQMMRDMGSAAWFIIDNTENFEWATAVSTNGDVYNNLIALCNNEISMAVSGAIVGQDTKFGSNGKESASQDLFWQLVQADMDQVQQYWNSVVIPAFQNIGFLKGDIYFEFDTTEDTQQLFERAIRLMSYYNVPIDFIKEKFGVEVQAKEQQTNMLSLNAMPDFFD